MPNENQPEGDEAQGTEELEPHLFSAGMDPNQSQALLSKLLSDDPDGLDALDGPEEKRSNDTQDSNPGVEAVEDEDEYETFEGEPEEDEGDPEEDEYEDFEGEVEDDESGGAEDSEEPDLYTVKVDGEEREVTLDELMSGYSFRSHNTRVSQELAESRRETDELAAKVREDREVYGQRLEELEKALEHMEPAEPDWAALKEADPQQYLLVRAEWDDHQRRKQAVADERQKNLEDQQADAVEQFNAAKRVEADKLVEAIPEWNDHDRARAELGSIKRAAIATYGYTDEELAPLIDSRAILVLRDALRHRRMKTKGKQAVERKRTKRGRTRVKPGARKPAGSKKTKAGRKIQAGRRRLAESGSLRDASQTIFDIISQDDEF